MNLFHPSNIYEESWMLLGTMKMLGLYPIKITKRTCANYIYVIGIIMSYFILHLHIRHYTYIIFQTFLSLNGTFIIRKMRYFINILLFPTIIISSMRQCSNLRKTLEQIDKVDKNIQFFNTKINHTLCMRNDIVKITTMLFVLIISNLIDYFGLFDNDRDYMYLLMWVYDRIPDFVCTMIICSFDIFINKIKFRFKQINTIQNIITKGKIFIFVSETSDISYNIFRYKFLKLVRLELRKTVSLINEVYGFRFKILSVIYITYIGLHICVIYMISNSPVYVVDTILACTWGTVDLIKLVYLIHLYRSLTLEYIQAVENGDTVQSE